MDIKTPFMLTITDVEDIEIVEYAWKSWAGLLKMTNGAVRDRWEPGHRMVPCGSPMPLFELACRKAFWTLSRSTVADLAKLKGVAFTRSSNLCELLAEVVGAFLKLDQAATLDIVAQRLNARQTRCSFFHIFLEIDEAVE
eukprot:4978303-Pyramimonas_sp.AAC.1